MPEAVNSSRPHRAKKGDGGDRVAPLPAVLAERSVADQLQVIGGFAVLSQVQLYPSA